MTFEPSLETLLTDESVRQREFPVTRARVFLAHAAVGPLPTVVVRAVSEYLQQASNVGQFEFLHARSEAGAREIVATMLGASADEIAFVPSTSAGLSLVAAGLDWEPGDNVVIADGDFPANVYPWTNLSRRGVTVRSIPGRGDGLITLEDVAAHVDEDTRLVSLSSVHFATGARMDIDAIGHFLHARGILFCVDAIQSLGALPLSVKHVDFLTADAHKWLLGPQGIGVLFVRRTCFEVLHPPALGWKSARDIKDFSNPTLHLAETARRFEPGSLNAIGLVGLHAALSMLQRVGVAAIGQRLLALRAFLIPRLADKRYRMLGPAAPRESSGITTFWSETRDASAIHHALDGSGVVVSLRAGPSGRPCLRVAPHFYTTEAELQVLLDRL